jgi:energy-coupling factor transporter ATP-binding protein EcfA2
VTSLIDRLPPPGSDPLDVIEAFANWAAEQGRPLYPHQEEAGLALGEGHHVVLATPTGSGKSTVAMLGIVLARNRGERSVWTAPIKALVAEKFFDLVNLLGASEIGLAIGDASINREAPVLVCTAEVFANQALAMGDASAFGFACLDEFHYYAEADRGWAWQVPLLCLRNTQFLLASATLGDIEFIRTDLERRTDRPVANITSVKRPTPLYHQWRNTTVAESVQDAIKEGLSPVYLVHGSQADAIERAQSLTSLPLTSRPQRESIAEALKGERLNTGFGQSLGRFLRNGVGVHHAGMLPRYRRLVEKLAGEGLLPVICGTDTLGVGVNIPIRTVLLSALTKYDGSRVRTLRAREFHQLSGRAGRPGFDPDGHVWAQAPDHVIDNERALAKAGDDPKARRKVKRAEPPKGFVHFDEATFNRLIAAAPEPLTSRFRVTPNLVASVLARPDGVYVLKDLLLTNHDAADRKRGHKKRAIEVYRSLEAAGVAQRQRSADGTCEGVQIGSLVDGDDERMELRFTSPLGPFSIEVISTLDREDPTYVLDVVSVVESVLEDPMALLIAQEKAARANEIGRLKSEGVGYEERLELLDGVTWPKPLAELLAACYETYQSNHPWIHERPSPKSILREMLESGETFAGYVNRYKIERSEGLLLRYLSDAYRTLDRSLSSEAYTDALEDVIEWLGGLLRAVDASLLEEWERLSGVDPVQREQVSGPIAAVGPPKAWKTAMRTAAFGWVDLFARKGSGTVIVADRTGWPQLELIDAMRTYWLTYDSISTDADARSAKYFTITEEPGRWVINQRFVDPEGDAEWGFTAYIDLAAAMEAGSPTLVLESIGPFGAEVSKS